MVSGLPGQIKILTVVSDQIPRVFNWAGATQFVALDISNTFNRVWNAIFFTNLRLTEFQLRIDLFCLSSLIDSLEWFSMGSLSKNIKLSWCFLKFYCYSYTFPTMQQ